MIKIEPTPKNDKKEAVLVRVSSCKLKLDSDFQLKVNSMLVWKVK